MNYKDKTEEYTQTLEKEQKFLKNAQNGGPYTLSTGFFKDTKGNTLGIMRGLSTDEHTVVSYNGGTYVNTKAYFGKNSSVQSFKVDDSVLKEKPEFKGLLENLVDIPIATLNPGAIGPKPEEILGYKPSELNQ